MRNVAAGSISKRLGIEEGEQLPHTLIEYYYKDDSPGRSARSPKSTSPASTGAGPEEMQDIVQHGDPHQRLHVRHVQRQSISASIDFKLEFGRIYDGDYSAA